MAMVSLIAMAMITTLASPAIAGPTADVAMRVNPSGAWVGGGVQSDDGTGQTLVAKVHRGSSKTFDIAIENQIGAPNTVTATSAGDQGKLLATWRDGLTASVVIPDEDIAAGYGRSVPTGQSLSLILKIKVKNTAKPGTVKSWPITGSAPGALSDTGVIQIEVAK